MSTFRRPRIVVTRLLALAIVVTAPMTAPAGAVETVPLGDQFQVNTYVTSSQSDAAAARVGADGFVVVWRTQQGAGTDPSGSLQGQRYDGDGAADGPQFQVNTYTTSGQTSPAVAADASGNFVVVWTSYGSGGGDTSDYSIQGQRYDASGAVQGAQFQVNTYTTSEQQSPAVAVDPSGGFIVAWQSDMSDEGSVSSVQARRYDASGTPLGAQFRVSASTTTYAYRPAVAATGAGRFVVVWMTYDASDNFNGNVQGQRLDAAGAPEGPEFQVNSYTTSAQIYPAAAGDGAGGFVVVWDSTGSTGSDQAGISVQARRYDSTGTPLGPDFQVNTYTTGNQANPQVAVDGAGDAIVVWNSGGSPGSDTSSNSVHARRFDPTGTAVGDQFQVNTYTTDVQQGPTVATDDGGRFLVAWSSNQSVGDTDGSSVHARRYAVQRPILGRKLLVKNPTGSEGQRAVIALAKETGTDIGAGIAGDPVANGAVLHVVANGTSFVDQTFVLDASGWTAIGSVGFKYSGPTGGDADPVRKVLLKRSPAGAVLLKAIIKGNIGTQSLAVAPPNTGDDGGIVLSIRGGGTYCASFGGAAGGTETRDDADLWKITNAGAEPGCPAPTGVPSCNNFGGPCGSCGDGICGDHVDPDAPANACVAQGSLVGSSCDDDSDCGPGLVCAGPGPSCGAPCL